MRYDIEKLREYADLSDIVSWMGINIKRSGSTNFIPCPDVSHIERVPDNCAISRDGKGCYCYACSKGFDVFDAVRGLSEKCFGASLSFSEVCGLIADSMGGREMFALANDGKPHRTVKKRNESEIRFYADMASGITGNSDVAQALKAYYTEKYQKSDN